MNSHDPLRRTRRTFWVLALVAVAAAGSVRAALGAPAGISTSVRLVVSGLVLVVAVSLAARVMIAVERARRQALGTGHTE